MKSYGTLIGAVALAWLLKAGPAYALSVTVVPAEHRIAVDAGDSVTREISVTNNGMEPITVQAYPWDWWYGPDGGHEFGPPGTFERSGAAWVEIFPREIEVGPGETGRLLVNVEMPRGSDGGYYAVAFVEARAGHIDPTGVAMRPGGRVAVPLLLEAEGTASHGLKLVDAEVVPPTATNPLQLKMQTLNVGDTHEYPEFMGAIRSQNGNHFVGRFRGNPTRILPGQQRSLDASWSGELTPGTYDVVGSLLYGDGRSEAVTETFEVGSQPSDQSSELVWLP